MKKWVKVSLLAITIIILATTVFLIIGVTQHLHYQGKDIPLELTNCNLKVTANEETQITIEAYSDVYFQYEKGETIIYSKPIKPPQAQKSYFYMNEEISSGSWQKTHGEAQILASIKSQGDVTVTVVPTERGWLIAGIVFCAIFVWFILFRIIIFFD